MIVGYARVSTDGQTLDAQHSALVNAGAGRVFSEKVSGAKTDRAALARAIATLGAGDDQLVICSTPSQLSLQLARRLSHSVIRGAIRQRHMGG
jgi:DNA invertase Pin-like site-specific DNA recombinase